MTTIIEFRKPEKAVTEHKLTQSEEILWNAVVKETYNKLLPSGLSQSLADEFLSEFRSLFIILLPKDIKIHFKEGMEEQAHQTQESINDHFIQCIGAALFDQLTGFLKRELNAH